MADLATEKIKIAVICGPTATGKTALSTALAKALDGEIISADSMQIYKGLDVGTAKATQKEQQGVPHHLLDFLDPEESFSVADYVKKAGECIESVHRRGKLPMVVGGTGLYISSLVNGISFTEEKTTPGLREKLAEEARREGPQAMWEKLFAIDPSYAAALHPNNEKRVLRALELYIQTGKTMSEQQRESLPQQRPYEAKLIGLGFHSREALYRRIDGRAEKMLGQGLLQEAEYVYQNKPRFLTAAQAIGYKEFFPYFEGKATLAACTEDLKRNSRRYAKRQMTWFGKMQEIYWLWLDEEKNAYEKAKEYFENGPASAKSAGLG